MDIDLAGQKQCPHCNFGGYEDDFAKGRCPRCKKSLDGPSEPQSDSRRGPARRGPQRGGGKRKKRGPGPKRVESPPEPPEKRQVILTEEFKTRVFDAFKAGDPGRGQDLCMELAQGNEVHAKQVYGYLLKIARKRGWVGKKGESQETGGINLQVPHPTPSAGAPLPAPGFTPGAPLPAPGFTPGAPLPAPGFTPGAPLPAPGFTPGAPLPAPGFGTGAPLPAPGFAGGDLPGFAPGAQLPPPGFAPGAPPPGFTPGAQVPPPGMGGRQPPAPGFVPGPPPGSIPGMGVGDGQDFQTIPLPPPDLPTGPAAPVLPPGSGGPTIRLAPGSVIPLPDGDPFAGASAGVPMRSAAAPTAPPPVAAATPTASNPPAPPRGGALAPAPPPPPAPGPAAPVARASGLPEERGFLARVAVEGRAAQVSLLCLAGRHAAAHELARGAVAQAPDAARSHAALGEALSGLGEDAEALRSYSSAVRVDPTDTVCVRGYARHLVRLGRHPEAAAAYKRIVAPGRGRVEDAVALAEALRKASDPDGAQRVLQEVTRRDPQSLEPLRQEIERRASSGDLAGAAERLQQLLEKEVAPHPIALGVAEELASACSDSASLARVCAQVFDATGRSLQAVRLLLPVARREPGDVGVRRVLGLAYARLGAARLAQEHLQVAIDQGAAGGVERFVLGEVLIEQGEIEAGARHLAGARDARGDDPEIRRALARALAARGDLEGAVRELRVAHELTRGDEAALEDELDRITARAFEQQLEEIEGRLRADFGDHEARLQLARALAQRGDVDDALSHLERVAEDPKGLPLAVDVASELLGEIEEGGRGLILFLARSLIERGDVTRAIELVEEHLGRRPDDHELQLALYQSYGQGGRQEEALEGLRDLAAVAPPQLLHELVSTSEGLQEVGGAAFLLPAARALRRLGDLEQCLGVYKRYSLAVPDDFDARREWAQVLEASACWAEAFEVLGPLAAALDQTPLAELEHLARVALRAGKPTQALHFYERAVARHPDDLAVKRGLQEARQRCRQTQIDKLQGATQSEDLLLLAGLYAEQGADDEARGVLARLGRTGENPELDYLRFCGEHFARSGQAERAEKAWRAMAKVLAHAPGSDPFKAFLYRAAELHLQGGDRRAARQALLEIQAHDPGYQDLEAKLEALTDVVPAHGRPDERVVTLVEVDAPQGTIFDAIRGQDLAI